MDHVCGKNILCWFLINNQHLHLSPTCVLFFQDLLGNFLTNFGPWNGFLLINVREKGNIILKGVQKGLDLLVFAHKISLKPCVFAHSWVWILEGNCWVIFVCSLVFATEYKAHFVCCIVVLCFTWERAWNWDKGLCVCALIMHLFVHNCAWVCALASDNYGILFVACKGVKNKHVCALGIGRLGILICRFITSCMCVYRGCIVWAIIG